MSDSVLEKYGLNPKSSSEMESSHSDEEIDDLGCFGFLRGTRERALMLELRFRDGSMKALSYAWLERVDFNPSEGFALRFGRTIVKITGQNLNREIRQNLRLSDGIVRHRIPWIREAEQSAIMDCSPQAIIVESLKIDE